MASTINPKEFIENVEKYCTLLQSYGIQRDQAESQLTSLLKLSQPYELFFSVLKESKSTLAHFYMLIGIRDASIREWAILDQMVKLNIIDFLYQYISNLNSMTWLQKATRSQSYNTLAVICKRSWLDTHKYQQGLELNQIIMEKIYSDLNSNNFNQMEAAVQMIHSFIIEFASKSKASRIQLTWEFHMKCLVSFQSLHLQPLFRKIMEILFHLKEPQTNPLLLSMLSLSLKIVCDILEWKFADKGIASLSFLASFSTVQYSLRPTIEWAPLFITKSENNYTSPICDLLFSLYPTVINYDVIPSILRTSFTQLATLTGPITKDITSSTQYLKILLEKLTPILEKCIQHQNWTEMQDISHLIHRLCLNFKFTGILSIGDPKLMIDFLHNITKFIISALELMKTTMASGEEDLESEIELDCLDILLRAWLTLITDIEEQQRRKKTNLFEHFDQTYQVFLQCSHEIYRYYIKTRLELSKIELSAYDQLEPDNDDNNDLNEDRNKYNDQLKSISYIGRINPIQSMDLLTGEIIRTTEALKTNPDPYLFESLHWLILFSGHLLFDMDNTILAAIPNTIEDQSYAQYTQGSNRDSVIELTNAIFKYSLEYENTLLKNGLIGNLSPLVSKTAVWFFSGWSLVYLLPSDTLNVQVSPKLLDAFGSDQNVLVITDCLIQKILLNLKYWSGDIELLKETCQLFYNLSSHGKLIKFILASKSWPTLFYLNEPGFEKLSPQIQSQLYKSTTNIIFKLNTPSEIKNAFTQFTQGLTQQLDNILSHQDFKNIAQDAIVKENIYLIFEKLKGILCVSVEDLESVFERSGAINNNNNINEQEIKNIQSLPFDLFLKYAKSLIALLSVYDHHNDVIQLILTLFSNFTKHQSTLDVNRAKLLYESIISLFQDISKITNTKNSDNTEYYNRIKILIKILYNIITYNDPSNEYPTIISKTVFNGINVVTPCLTNKYNLLQFPKLARNYFMVLTFIFNLDDISEINNFQTEISSLIFRLIESGLLHHDLEIVKGCFECISGMTDFAKKLKEKNREFDFSILNQYVGSVINFLLLHDFNIDEILSTAADCLFNLMISNYEGYKMKIIELVNRQDPSIQQTLAQSFESLVINGTDRKSKDAFIQQLKQLLEKAKPLLKKQ